MVQLKFKFLFIIDSCKVIDLMKNKISFCVEDYNILNEDLTNYNYSWKLYNSSYKPEYKFERVYQAFQYSSASELDGFPVSGIDDLFSSGGYVFEMRGQISYLKGNLTLLEKYNWIDRQTRAIIVDLSIFNPNINLIGVAEIIVEFLPTGTIVPSARFDPIQIFIHLSLFQLICHIIYMLFIIYYSIQEIRQFCKQGKMYLLQFWTIVEWSIIGFSWTAFGLFFYRMNAADKVGQFFKQTSGYGYFKFQNIVFWNSILNYSLAFCIAFGTLKFIKVFQFNNVLLQLGKTLKNCINELIAFFFMFLTIFVAFVQLFHFSFQNKILGFSAVSRSMISCFEIMLGKFEVDPFLELNSIFGPIIYVFYNIFIVFIMLPVFITIISNSFKVVCDHLKKREDSMSAYLFEKVCNFFSNKSKYEASSDEKSKIVYKDQIEYLCDKIDDFLLGISEVKEKSVFYLKLLVMKFHLNRFTLNNGQI